MRALIIAMSAAVVGCSTDQFSGSDATTDGPNEAADSSAPGDGSPTDGGGCLYDGPFTGQSTCFGTNCSTFDCCVSPDGAACNSVCVGPSEVPFPCTRTADCPNINTDGGGSSRVCCIEDVTSVGVDVCPHNLGGSTIKSACVAVDTCTGTTDGGTIFFHACVDNGDCALGTCQAATLDVNGNLVFGVCR